MLARRGDPIAAIATAAGRAGVGIVRVSGRDLAPVIAAVCGRALAPRVATYLPFRAADGSALDQGLALHFPAPHSYTGEDVLELQAHGGPVVLQLLLARCLEAGATIGLRVADPGEFTERAFLNGKLDLAQAEAVADLIDATTEAAARSAGRSLAGAFSTQVGALRDALIELRVLVEATLDFPEEEIDFLERADAHRRLAAIRERLDGLREQARAGALLRDGLRVAIAGQPNVGKSSLLNALAGAELAIVTPIPGTTRDRIRESIQIDGVPVHVTDTAGLREASDEVERIGIARSWDEIAGADALLFVHDLSRSADAAHAAADAVIAGKLPSGARVVHVWNKADALEAGAPRPADGVVLSARTGEGLEDLRRRLLALAGWHGAPEGSFLARERHLQALRRTGEHLERAAAHAARRDLALDLYAEELRLAHDALGEIVGAMSSDALLGEVFGRFCIGK